MGEVPVVQIGRRNRSIDGYENRHLKITMCVCVCVCVVVVEWLVSHGLLDVTSKPSLYSLTNQGSYLNMVYPPSLLFYMNYYIEIEERKKLGDVKSLSDQDKLHRFTAITPLPAQNS